jgi:hypothetical protein
LLAVPLGETENDARVKFLVNYEGDYLLDLLALRGLSLLLLPLVFKDLVKLEVIFEFSDSLREILLLKDSLLIDYQV